MVLPESISAERGIRMSRLLIANNRTEAMVGDLAAMSATARRLAGCGALRALWFAEDTDVLVLPRLPDDDFLDYVTSWTGTRRTSLRLLAPPPGAIGVDLLTADRLADPGFLSRLREAVADRVIDEVLPVVAEPEIAALVGAIDLATAWPGCAFGGQGGVALVNSKAAFRAVSAGAGAPVPHGAVARTARSAEEVIETELAAGHAVILKQDHQVGGAGNEVLGRGPAMAHPGARRFETLTDRPAVARFLRERWDGLTVGGRDPVVIERYVPGSVAVYAEYAVTDDGVALLFSGQMTMAPTLAGVMVPAPVLSRDQTAYLVEQGRLLLETYHAMGYRGVAAADAIRTPDGEVLFTEINCRISGVSHMVAAIARSIGGAGVDDRVVLMRDGWQAPSFADAVTRVDAAGLTLDRRTRTGVLPDGDTTSVSGTFGVSIVAEDVDGLRDYERRLGVLFG
jgi:Pre ATP-grasp domain/PGM1 C-terminal domain